MYYNDNTDNTLPLQAPSGANHTAQGAGTGGGGGWVPPLQNMIDALDKMTFARVLFTMDKVDTYT